MCAVQIITEKERKRERKQASGDGENGQEPKFTVSDFRWLYVHFSSNFAHLVKMIPFSLFQVPKRNVGEMSGAEITRMSEIRI